jgi:hypothetical protein
MKKAGVALPVEIGCSDPRSQKRDLGHPSLFSDDTPTGGYLSVFSDARALVGMGVRMVVAGMVMFVDLDRRGAAVGYFAFDTLELDSGVIDAELLP